MTPKRVLTGLLVAVVVVGGAACADRAPTAPAAGPLSLKMSAYDLDDDGEFSAEEKAAKKADKALFEQQRKEWKAYKKAVKKGLIPAEFLRCEPLKRERERKVIGPKGGEIKVGPHMLEIPAGALTEEVEITAETVGGPAVDVQFQPHGLVFAEPVTLTMSYKHCILPVDPTLEVGYYTNREGNGEGIGNRSVIELPPSLQDKDEDEVKALTDHFSGYALVTRRPTN